jgi:hypothetical protein
LTCIVIAQSSISGKKAVSNAAMLEAERIVKDASVKGCQDLNKLFTDLTK